MTTERSYTTIDKADWGPGPWQDEPDKIQWVDGATDLDCLIVRNRMGALCGYVGVPPTHPWHGQHYGAKVIETGDEWDGCIDYLVDVHGGLTYSSSCQEDQPEAEGICHIPLAGRSPDMWWFGFDCAHSGDLSPWMPSMSWGDETYRTIDYVRRECAKLARQLVATPHGKPYVVA